MNVLVKERNYISAYTVGKKKKRIEDIKILVIKNCVRICKRLLVSQPEKETAYWNVFLSESWYILEQKKGRLKCLPFYRTETASPYEAFDKAKWGNLQQRG